MTKKQSKTTAKEVKYIPDTAHIITLNQELTEENSRLVERVDELEIIVRLNTENVVDWQHSYYTLQHSYSNLELDIYPTKTELTTIKSKWWYKLFRNW